MKTTTNDYKGYYFRNSTDKAREGKCVTISTEHHQRISRIIAIIGSGNCNLYDYINNVLNKHFEECGEAIQEEYRNLQSDLY